MPLVAVQPAPLLPSADLLRFGVIDHGIEEPLGGAHRDPYQTASRLKFYPLKTLRKFVRMPIDNAVQARYEKYRRMGVYLESSLKQAAVANTADAEVESPVDLSSR